MRRPRTSSGAALFRWRTHANEGRRTVGRMKPGLGEAARPLPAAHWVCRCMLCPNRRLCAVCASVADWVEQSSQHTLCISTVLSQSPTDAPCAPTRRTRSNCSPCISARLVSCRPYAPSGCASGQSPSQLGHPQQDTYQLGLRGSHDDSERRQFHGAILSRGALAACCVTRPAYNMHCWLLQSGCMPCHRLYIPRRPCQAYVVLHVACCLL